MFYRSSIIEAFVQRTDKYNKCFFFPYNRISHSFNIN